MQGIWVTDMAIEEIGEVSFADNAMSKGKTAAAFFGYGPDSIPESQKVKINSKAIGEVVFALQDKISLSTESMWDSMGAVAGASPFADIANVLTQLISGGKASTVNKETSRRFWKGTTPLKMTIPLKLDAENDASIDVTEAVMNLKKMAAPSESIAGFLSPPGPSPYKVDQKKIDEAKASKNAATKLAGDTAEKYQTAYEASDLITVTIGDNYLFFDNVIIKNVQADIYNQFDRTSGHAVAADVILEIQSYSVLTKEALDNAFKGKPNLPMNKLNKFLEGHKNLNDLVGIGKQIAVGVV